MIELQEQSDNTMESLFKDEILLENFFPGAGRGELLAQMKGAVENQVPLMIISGGEGTGKTMMCRMLEQECRDNIVVVFFPRTVESFEDVVRIVAGSLGLQQSGAEEGKTVDVAIEKIVAHLLRHSQGLLVIFDEAENIYLATLERIRKMLDRITASGARLQILFSGRKTFLENCDQLSMCDFRNTENLHFDVLPLSEQETYEYLRFCLERLDNPEKMKVFNDEVVRNIHGLAKGKFRRINLLAGESLRSHGDDTSFMVLLDSVQDDAERESDKLESARPVFGRALPYIYWAGGALCTLLLLFFFLNPGEEQRLTQPVSLPLATITQKEETASKNEGEQQQPAMQAVQPVIGQEPQHQEVLQEPSEVVGKKLQEEQETSIPEPMQPSENMDTSKEIAAKPPGIVPPATKNEVELLTPPVQQKTATSAEVKVPELRQVPPLKVRPANQPDSSIAAGKLPRTEVQEIVGTATVDQIFQKRLSAGTAWIIGEKNDKFTVQLMVLTAKNAELNLKRMLAQPNYRQEAGNFYIFKKNGSSEVVLVFYGEYPTIEMARIAQNSLPSFLQAHLPYAISIRGALAKIEK